MARFKAFFMGLIATAAGMCGGVPLASAQVVQLPSSRSLLYSGSVWVPDGGTVEVGGVGSYSSYSQRSGWGPFASRAAATSIGTSSITVSASIIDLQALDEAILAAAQSQSLGDAVDRPAAPEARLPLPPPVPDAGANRATGRDPRLLENDIRYYVALGEAAHRAGRPTAAGVYFQLARDLMTPELSARYEGVLKQREEAEAARRAAEVEAVRRSF